MGRFTAVPQDTFQALQLDAGVLLNKFDPENPAAPKDEDIITATTGGITVNCTPTFSDLGEDVDNVPVNMMEFKHLDGWECGISTTGLGTSPRLIKLALGCADIDASKSAIVPRMDLKQSDFSDIWWVGDRADGGLVAVQLKNALATSGFSLQTSKNGKGQTTLEIAGHVSIKDQKNVPMRFYSMDAPGFSVTQTLTHVTSDFDGDSVVDGGSLSVLLTADDGYELSTVSVTMGGVDITSTSVEGGIVRIASVTGDVVITATATEEI